ncbi:MAG: dihydrofolate reductase [Flavobacteriales bacterium]|jgi:dihydrofolate reductase|nr:dihydrofolate reductase [Flavobacteriales bacterium]MBK7943647.1 dihydrofolate reductase [Flavobacteriales bacterium]MBK9699669.1 dihydrofolate reductase [Flavobacteriales bacterium]
MIVSAIAAVSANGVIGRDGDLPWHLPDDMAFFQRTTRGHCVITGRLNWESIPVRYRPLKHRTNIVVTRNPAYNAPGAVVVDSLEAALDHARALGEPEAFIIGGGQLYREALAKELVHRIYLTRVHAEIEGDTHFPMLDAGWREVWREEHPADHHHAHPFTFLRLEREEQPA